MKSEQPLNYSVQSHFGGQYHVSLKAFEGLDFSRRCFVFPGQSAAFPGMMKAEIASSQVAMERFQAADRLASELGLPPVSHYILTPEKLSAKALNVLRNPALFTLEVAFFDHLLAQGLRPAAITGQSFGEYAALVVSGMGRFEDVFKIVVMRDQLSPVAKSRGLMIAANATLEEASVALKGIEFFLSNINSPKQIVISVQPSLEKKALSAFKAAKIAARTLSEMSQPYHTPLLNDVRENLASYIRAQGFEFSAPKIPMITSVGAEILGAASLSIRQLSADPIERITRQVSEATNFPEQIRRSLELGAINFIEMGPGEICSQFIKATLGESLFKISSLNPFFAQAAMVKVPTKRLRTEKSRLLGTLSKAIAAVTGYSIDEISVEQNFQEDLGIDSIRKAEIVFKFMESMNKDSNAPQLLQVNLSQLKRIEDVIEHFENVQETQADDLSNAVSFERYSERWAECPVTDLEKLNLVDDPFVEAVALDLMTTSPGDLPWLKPELSHATLILRAPDWKPSPEFLTTSPRANFEERLLPWIRAFREISQKVDRWNVRIALVSGDQPHPYLAAFDGFLKSWLKEDAFESYKRIYIPDAIGERELVDLVRTEFSDQRHSEALYEDKTRYVRLWQREAIKPENQLGENPVVVSLGGSRGIGAAILEKFASEHPHAQLYVLGRSAETSEGVATTVAFLKQACSQTQYRQVDAFDNVQLREALEKIASAHGKIDVVLNGAGIEISRSLKSKSDEEIWQEFEGKVAPATELARLADQIKINHVINYSSVAAAFGNTGQTIYALGNQVQVGIGETITSRKGTRVTSMVLPPWDNLGMTENAVVLGGLKASGVAMLPREAGARLVNDEICFGRGGQVAFLDSRDPRAYDCGITDRRAHESLFSRPISAGTPLRLPTLNRRDQVYLNDHVINGNVIYPGSSALALRYYVGYHYFKCEPVIENFEVRSFLAPESEVSTCEISVQKVDDKRARVQISSRQAVHFICEIVNPGQDLLTSAPSADDAKILLKPFEGEGRIECEPLYGNEHVNLGPHFQLANQLWFNKDRELLQTSYEGQLTRLTPVLVFDRLQQWFESVLQVMGCQLLCQTRRYWVPNRIGRIVTHFKYGLTPEISYRAVIHEVQNGQSIGNSYALNEKGDVIIEFHAVEDIEVGRDEKGGNFRLKSDDEAHAAVLAGL